jgi:serine/threonine-protein kinase RsbW
MKLSLHSKFKKYSIMTSITIPADYEHLSLAYNLVEAQAKELGLNESEIYGIKLATDEAVTNIILHGYSDYEGDVRIDVEQRDNALVIILTDSGRQYDPTKKAEPDLSIPLSDRSRGGMGVFLMKKNMDSITYTTTKEGGNQLTMIKQINN